MEKHQAEEENRRRHVEDRPAAQDSLQRILRGWVVFHVPPSVLLFGLMLFHIWTGLSFR